MLDSAGDVGNYPSIGIDATGGIHISYFNATDEDLKYAHYDGAWHIEILESTGAVGGDTSLGIDSLGHIHISYRHYANQPTRYISNVSGLWEATTIEGSSFQGVGSTSLCVGPDDAVHIAYRELHAKGFRYAKRCAP